MILFAPVMHRSYVQNTVKKLYIDCVVGGEPHLVLMTEMIALPASDIGEAANASRVDRDAIVTAVDLLVTGF